MIRSAADRLREEGMKIGEARGLREGEARGLREGEARGEARGLRMGKAEMLVDLLGRRFGTLSDAAKCRIRRAAEEQLDAWSSRVFDAKTLKEALAE